MQKKLKQLKKEKIILDFFFFTRYLLRISMLRVEQPVIYDLAPGK